MTRYDQSGAAICNFSTHSSALKEALADLFSALVLKINRPAIHNNAFTNSISDANLYLKAWHFSPTTRKIQSSGAFGCGSVYAFGNAFKQGWYEIANNQDCNIGAGCPPFGEGGPWNGSGLGFTNQSNTQRDILRALATASVTEGTDTYMEDFSDAMVDVMDDFGYSSTVLANMNSVLDHHGL